MDMITIDETFADINRDFAIRLPNGLLLVCWNKDSARGAGTYFELPRVLQGLAEARILPSSAKKLGSWVGDNLVLEGFDEPVRISYELGLAYDCNGLDNDKKLDKSIEVILALVSRARKSELVKLYYNTKDSTPAAPKP